MARSRSRLSPGYEARNARARAEGYRNDYDRRIHNHGRIPASSPAPTGEARSRLRGHRSSADLERAKLDGALVSITDHSGRDNKGRYKWVEVTVVDARGKQRTFRLTGKQLQPERLGATIAAVQGAGGFLSPSPSLDLASYGADDDEPGDLEDYDLEDEAA